MNIAVIFAGGTGQRMNTKSKPKQFLDVHGKPVLIYTLEIFENHEEIDSIVLVCLESWIDFAKDLLCKYGINKVKHIVPGGNSGQESIFNGLKFAFNNYPNNSIVLIHDGVRPLINRKIISESIACVKENGTAVTVSPAIETIVVKTEDGVVGNILDRKKCEMAKAPQSFILDDIYNVHLRAQQDNCQNNFIDSASLMQHYGYVLKTVEGPAENIKITTPSDFYIFRAILDAKENLQILGL